MDPLEMAPEMAAISVEFPKRESMWVSAGAEAKRSDQTETSVDQFFDVWEYFTTARRW